MKHGNAIEVSDVSKSYKIFIDKGNTIKERALFSKRRRHEYRKVLNRINLEVKKGEAIGLIGHNGCGKSTTLKLLTKIIYPDKGAIEINGRVSSLIELGAGFHPDMSGRENIYINASIFGLKRKEIDKRLDDIIAFSELEDYIDNPVRTYSSGMYMRLAFSVAINVNADVLLIDEILAVGDANFQAKCFNKLREIKARGTTIVIVSHSLGQIEQICERSVWIHDGNIREEGTPRKVHPIYLDYMGNKRAEIAEKEADRQAGISRDKVQRENPDIPLSLQIEEHENSEIESLEEKSESNVKFMKEECKRWGNGDAQILSIELLNSFRESKSVFETGEKVIVKIQYKVIKIVKDAIIGIGIFRNDNLSCYGTNTRIDKLEKFDLDKDGEVEIMLNNVNLLSGEYFLDIAIESGDGIPIDFYREALKIEFISKISDVGVMRIDHTWNFK